MYIHSEEEELNKLFYPNYEIVGFADCHYQGLRTLKGTLFNTGSVGNSLGVPNVNYSIIKGDISQEAGVKSAYDISLISLPYDNQKEIRIMQSTHNHPSQNHYMHEVESGNYSKRFEIKK